MDESLSLFGLPAFVAAVFAMGCAVFAMGCAATPSDDATSREQASSVSRASTSTVSFIGSRDYTPRVLKLIDAATASIDLVDFVFTDVDQPGSAQDILQHLIAKKTAHDEIRIRVFLEDNFPGLHQANASAEEQLRAAHIDVFGDAPELITHTKAICIDGQTLLTGSHNLENSDLDRSFEASLEFSATQHPQVLRGFHAYFEALLANSSVMQPITVEDGSVKMVSDSAYLDEFINFIDTAQTSLDLTNYAFGRITMGNSDPASVRRIIEAFDRAKNQRHVQIRLFLEQADKNHTHNYRFAVANQLMAKTLQNLGIDTVHFDDPTVTAHAKFAVRDGEEVMLGSHNWIGHNLDHAHDLDWRIADPALAQQLSDVFNDKYDHASFPPITIAAEDSQGIPVDWP